MDQLPVDTLIYLFQYLHKRDLFQASYVNKQWYSLIFERRETWIHQAFIVSSDQFFPEQAMNFMEECKISKIDFSVENDSDLVKFERIMHFPWLTDLGLTRRLYKSDEEDDVLVLNKMPDQMNLNGLEFWTDKCYDAVLQLLQANSHSLEKLELFIRWDYEKEEDKIQQCKETILSIKKLKSLSSRSVLFRNDEEFDRFASVGYPLEELTIPDEKGFSKASWDKLFSSSSLKKLHIDKEGWGENEYESHDKDKFIKIREQPTLEELNIGDRFPYSTDIIKSGMLSLKELTVCGLKNVDLSGLYLPNLEVLDLAESDVSAVLDIFNACGDKLKQLTLKEIEGTIVATPKKKFENLKLIYGISYCDFSIVEYVLDAIGSTELDDLTINDIAGTPDDTSLVYITLLSHLENIARAYVSVDMFLAFPEVVLPTLKHLTINSSDFTIDNAFVERLVKCTAIESLDLDEATSITASNWMPRLLAAIPQLGDLRAEKGKLESPIHTSAIVEETKLTSLHIDLTSLNVEQLTTILLKSPSLTRFGSDNHASSYEHLSTVYSLMSSVKSNIASHYIYLRDPPEASDIRLTYLNHKMNRNSIKFGVKYPLEHMILIAIASCDGTGGAHYFDIDDEKIDWLADMILSDDGLELKQQIVELIPSLVEQLDNVDEEKKQDIISRHSDPKNFPEYMTDFVKDLMRNYSSYAEGASRYYSSNNVEEPQSYEEAKERMLKKHKREMKHLLSTQQEELEELEAKWKRKENGEMEELNDTVFNFDDFTLDGNDPFASIGMEQDSDPFSFDD